MNNFKYERKNKLYGRRIFYEHGFLSGTMTSKDKYQLDIKTAPR